MTFKCLCGKRFTVEGDNAILPKHNDQTGEVCPGSEQSVKDMSRRRSEGCPLGMPGPRCEDCGFPA